MSESDLECFIWNSENDGEDDSDEDVYYEYEVKKSQEKQEDFEILPGFQIHLPQQIISDICDGYPLQPTVVESVTSQTLITKKKINATPKMIQGVLKTEHRKFKEDFSYRLDGYALRISNNMSFKNLEMLIENGLPEMEAELLGFYRKKLEDVKTQMELKKSRERDSIKEDAEIFTKYVCKKLRQEYTYGPHYHDVFNKNNSMDQGGETQSQLSIEQVRQSMCQSMCQTVFEMFMDEELDYHKLIKKYFWGPDQSLRSFFFAIVNNITRNYDSKVNLAVNHAETLVNTTPDRKFINEITSIEFESLSKQKHELIDIFLKEYKRWKKEIFPKNIQEIIPRCDGSYTREVTKKFDSEYLRYKKIIEEEEFNRICKEIENKFPKGPILMILNLYGKSYMPSHISNEYKISYEIETFQSDQLKITIYQTSIDERDNFLLSEDEIYIPTLKFNYKCSGNSFQINPETHEIWNISQFENKFFLALWNNKENRLEIYFDTASRLSSSIQSKPFKILYAGKNSLISVNEPKGLIGLYDISSGDLNVYAFDEKFVILFLRHTNIQLVRWYNCMVPEIQHFFFIKDTEDICFIEKNGRSRIYMMVSDQFRPSSLQLPPKFSKVLSTPDGACIVAFTKDTMLEQENENNDADSNTEKADDYNPKNQIEIIKAHVFFCAKFGSPAIITMPKNMQSVEHFQFSYIKKQQMHLTTLDVVNGQFCSLITKITLEKSMGKVRILASDHRNDNYSFLEGRDTQFSKNVFIGESIVIQNEKRCVLEIQSNTRLKIAGTFSNIDDLDSWMDFRIEPKTNINSFVNVYQYMFEKYPINSCIDTEQNKSLSLTITLDLSSRNVEDYEEIFRDYIDKMFEELKRSTKKPASSLKKFKIDVMNFSELNIGDPDFQENKTSRFNVGEWIIRLFCLIPIQIAASRNNAKLCVIIKDVPVRDKSDIVRKFYLKLSSMIAQTCDWGSLDDNLVEIRVSTLKRLLQTAISIGVEENNPTIVNLMNHDIGTKIDDPVIKLAEISEDFDNYREIFSDEGILLFEENIDFVCLSADLRTKEHQCHETCEGPGICRILTEPQKREEICQGNLDKLAISAKYIQLGERLLCCKKIPPNMFRHEGTHSHSLDNYIVHFCDVKCQFCEYYCTLPYGHAQPFHETSHGYMHQTDFMSEHDIKYASSCKLQISDQYLPVLCNLYCKEIGRHLHVDYCKDEGTCKLNTNNPYIKHVEDQFDPNPQQAKDFISHHLFWERSGFKDPYSTQDQLEYAKCYHECPNESHWLGNTKSSKSYCELPLFHQNANPSQPPPNGIGYISLDGHYFHCENCDNDMIFDDNTGEL
ncbi:11111_t:CDS:10 [Acaulospora morrowiae]|uniref:11111_t:CDS:1 n=1 Tax=Acaulospora morrowiae TaxID=94023 RepID=A0A9N9B2M6_9GLOM|nr:11111_t:CDS:10 [Acaulospora morrowiae]